MVSCDALCVMTISIITSINVFSSSCCSSSSVELGQLSLPMHDSEPWTAVSLWPVLKLSFLGQLLLGTNYWILGTP